MMTRLRRTVTAALLMLPLGFAAACSAAPTVATPATPAISSTVSAADLTVESPWVRTTAGTQDPSMTAAFMTIVNPTSTTVKLVGASVDASVAAICQVHEMVTDNGTVVMREAKDGIEVPAGSHSHLMPGGPHVMLMQLAHGLNVGDEVTFTLKFSDGRTLTVTAPVKQAPAETEAYHTHAAATPSR